MKILGINYGHNATVCLMEDGKIVFCQSEERLNRIKNSTGFPTLTLDYIYQHIAEPAKIDLAVLYQKSVYGYLHIKQRGFQPYQYGNYLDPSMVKSGLKQWLLKTEIGWNLQKLRISRTEAQRSLLDEAYAYYSNALKLPKDRVLYLDHHLSHAYSVIPNVQNWGRVLVFTLDGQGEWTSGTVSVYEDKKLRTLSRIEHRNSLGYFYSCTTSILGMKSGEHEFKVMGLAPYARPTYYKDILRKLSELLTINEGGEWVSSVKPSELADVLEEVYRYQRFDNVAGAIQELTEKLIVQWINFWIEKTGCHDIAVSGGVFMNVKACQRVLESKNVSRFFVMPSAGDESCPIGCVVWASLNYDSRTPIEPLGSLYLGREFSNEEIEKAIYQTHAIERYNVLTPSNINEEMGRLLANDEIVARCSGRMEFGARALGNRSILANPSNWGNLRHINEAIKSRDFWMPFTPSILEEDMPRYIQGHDRIFAPYMCITFDSSPEARIDLVAAIHPADFTVRPQCVKKEWNPDYYEIINTFKSITGIGGVLNTSFNLHGEPNVCSPHDSIRTVDNSGLAFLAMGKFLLRKKSHF